MFQKVKLIDYKDFRINVRVSWQNRHVGNILPQLKKIYWLKIQDRIIYKMLMLTYKSYYNMAPPYLCELINKKESHENTPWELIIISLLCHQLVRIVLTLSLSVQSFMLLQANGTNWVNISGHQILIVSGKVLKQCYIHINMDADYKCIYYCYLWCDHCWLL